MGTLTGDGVATNFRGWGQIVYRMGVDPWVDRGDMCPYFLKWRGRPVLSPATFSGVNIFCTNAHGIDWMIGAIFVAFYQSLFLKIIKIFATRCKILRLKCTKFNFGWGSAPDPAGKAYGASPTL